MISKKYLSDVVKNEQVIKTKLAKNFSNNAEDTVSISKKYKDKNKPEISFNEFKTKNKNVKKTAVKVEDYAEFDFRTYNSQVFQKSTTLNKDNLKPVLNSNLDIKNNMSDKKYVEEIIENQKHERSIEDMDNVNSQLSDKALDKIQKIKNSEENQSNNNVEIQDEFELRSTDKLSVTNDIDESEEVKKIIMIARMGALFDCVKLC